MRLLVAEDDRGLREALGRGLREHGFAVDTVPDGRAAMGYLRSYDYEVAVLDWRMPDVSGLGVLRWMRQGAAPCSRCPGAASCPAARAARRPGPGPRSGWNGPSRRSRRSRRSQPACSAGHRLVGQVGRRGLVLDLAARPARPDTTSQA